MKKWLFGAALLLALACAIITSALPTRVEAATYGVLTYEISGGEVTITDCDETASGELVIPDTIEGYPVTGIGDSAFYNCRSLTSVVIPNGVTSIGYWAFSGCKYLCDVTIPDSVTYIGFNAFTNCASLTYSIYDNAKYLGNDDNPYVILKESVSDNITRCEVHQNTKFIHDHAFEDCTSLTSITIPDRVISIGENAFWNCICLTSVTIPDSITSIGMLAFYKCGNLSRVYITDVAAWCKIVFIDGNANPLSHNAQLYVNGEPVTNLTIPSGVTSIVNYAFWNCASLTSVTVPDSVTSIGLDAFGGCSGLVNITLPFVGNSKKTATDTYQYPFGYIFGTTAYAGSTATKQYYYGSDTSSPTYSTYYIPSGLKSVTITGGEILYGAFNNCANLTNVTIPDSVTSIGVRAFQGCSNLTDMAIPAGVTSIGKQAFSSCSSLTDVAIPAGVDSIAESAFSGCDGLTSVTIPAGVTSIGYTAFAGCTGLTSIVIPDGMDTIYYYAFSSCPNLNHVLFTGDEAGWDWIYFQSGNSHLQNAIRHYNCTGNEIVDGICVICGLGDADGDQVITANDAYVLKQYRTGLVELDEKILALCDVSGDGKVDAYDAYLIQLYVAEIIDKFPCEN